MKSKLLLIDESSPYLFIVKKILINEGFEVGIAETKEGVNNYLKNTLPDIILIDVLMNSKNGFAILEKLKSEHNFLIPILVISAGKNIEIIKKAFNLGAYDYLIKPLNFRDLKNKINKALERAAQNKRQFHV